MMNKVVSISEVSQIGIRVKDGITDQTLIETKSHNWTKEQSAPSVLFNFGNPDVKTSPASKLRIGNYYKIQLCYYDLSEKIGYYSTISIVKYTTQPSVSLVSFNKYVTNVDISHYVGSYINVEDASEKAYQYKFTLYDINGNVLETSGWLIHDVTSNEEMGKSKDEYDLTYYIHPDEKYYIQYSIITNNGLECNSPRYQLVGTTSIKPELDATLLAELNYDSGSVNLRLRANVMPIINTETKQRQIPQLSGSFILVRSSSVENFNIWTRLYSFYLTGKLPDDIIFTDYTLEQGQTYRYAIQQYNDQGVYSDKMYAKKCVRDDDDVLVETDEIDLIAGFEDMFLFDGERQLKIRFNPKVSSFKTVVQETKKNTLGSKYPFFFRSGATEYKEFPINGLISYLADDNQDFALRVDDLKMPINWENTTDILDENLTYERRFKLMVLNWLNDGCIKLFRSPAEGNYLVRLMNITLSPENDALSRMIHTFSCTATEVDDYVPSKLNKYGFLHFEPEMPKQLRFGSISLDAVIEEYIKKSGGNVDKALSYVAENCDLLNGLSCQYIHIEDCWPSTEFELGGESYYIGATGNYEASFTDAPHGLYIKNPRRHMGGTIHYGVLTTQSNVFDTVSDIYQYDVFDIQDVSPSNYIAQHTDIKKRINKIYFMNFYINDLVYEFESIEQFQQYYHILMDSEHEEQYRVYLSGRIESETGVFTKEQIAEMNEIRKYGTWQGEPGQSTYIFNFNDFMAQYYQTQTGNGIVQFDYITRGAQDLYIDNTIIRTTSDNRLWRYKIGTYYADNNSFYGMYASITPIGNENSVIKPSCVYIDNEIIDLSITGSATLPLTDTIPNNIHWGSAVTMCACYQVLEVTYGEEFNTHIDVNRSISLNDMRQLHDESYKLWCAKQLDLIPYRSVDMISVLNHIPIDTDQAYFIWSRDRFYRMSYEDCIEYNGSDEIWICNTGIKYSASQGAYVYNASNRDHTYNYTSSQYYGQDQLQPSALAYDSYHRDYLSYLAADLAAKEVELNLDEG